ncbi:acyl carrier protein [Mariniflexile fucanivorans]|uniref:Acyl carrier protein n=1 Tax=Mariniflexile fucanivorans TaxID=264023 RepID=A0A4R1RG01_9FLAO|nr:acyl carrier protein [Mariniflexile fucanivorans]TCL64856.1 acyl carrier protein [Mariniflexile fucanivorans]
MERNDIVLKLKNILAETLEHTNFEINDALTAKDVDGWDSLSHMIIITQIEKEFGIKFKLRDLNKLDNVGALIDVIQTKL